MKVWKTFQCLVWLWHFWAQCLKWNSEGLNILFYSSLVFCYILVKIDKMTEIQFGDSVKDLFQGFLKKHSLENCISIKFGNNGGSAALNVVAESREVADFWIRGLQKLIINKGNILPQNNFYQLVPDIQLLKMKGASKRCNGCGGVKNQGRLGVR